jgi:uncharacterized membrane protein (DUF373 family)
MLDFLKRFEHLVVTALITMMILVIFLSTIELAWIIIQDIITPPIVILEINQLLEIFGFFLLILIGIELLETIKVYLIEKVIHVEIVLEVALIALARKVIVLDTSKYDGVTILAYAALIIAVSVAFYSVKKKKRDA